MRNAAIKLPYFLFCLVSIDSYAQADTMNIDPRQYVTVQYRKSSTQGRLDTLWNWEHRINVPNQKFRYIDIDGEIKIDFLKNELIANKFFEGTFSLQAEISGTDGTRKIEVNPYSEIGVQREPIGIKSEPPAEIAKKLLNMLKELEEAEAKYDWLIKPRSDFLKDLKDAFKYANERIGIVRNYLKSFEDAGEDANKAFLALINKDLIGYSSLVKKLEEFDDRLQRIASQVIDPGSIDTIVTRNTEFIIETMKYLSELSRFEGSPLETIVTDNPGGKGLTGRYEKSGEKKEDKKSFFTFIDQNREKIALIISKEAGKLIYKKLVFAIIDLGKSGAKNGEVLNLYMIWMLDSKKANLDNSPRLPIGKYYLRETGWKMEVADMFAMIKRIDEQKADPAAVSPSNFKGSGGAVLMWTFNKEDRGIRITAKDDNEYSISRKKRFVNFLEPSIGLNISYLDFSTDKDVEIGTGLQLGIFRNKIFFGYGVNLHMLSPKNQSPRYFYIGFSFARLSDLFKNSNSVTASQ